MPWGKAAALRSPSKSPLHRLRPVEALGQRSKPELGTDENKAGYKKTYKTSPKWAKKEGSPTTNTTVPGMEGRECW